MSPFPYRFGYRRIIRPSSIQTFREVLPRFRCSSHWQGDVHGTRPLGVWAFGKAVWPSFVGNFVGIRTASLSLRRARCYVYSGSKCSAWGYDRWFDNDVLTIHFDKLLQYLGERGKDERELKGLYIHAGIREAYLMDQTAELDVLLKHRSLGGGGGLAVPLDLFHVDHPREVLNCGRRWRVWILRAVENPVLIDDLESN